ncbi:MAG: 5-(carboxyamino)imidazole ribonucleotide mutase [bacterium]|nr:5-(carboxyamino)imidazole ribonucleotide mutase [bacterium]
MPLVLIIMGSKQDIPFCKNIKEELEKFGIESVMRIGSAHKVPLKVLEILKEYEDKVEVIITVAGKSNALSGFVDAQITKPVIACPPYSEKFGGADLFSSLRMPKGVAPLVVLEPEQAALAAAKIIGIQNAHVRQKVEEYQRGLKEEIEKSDKELLDGQC